MSGRSWINTGVFSQKSFKGGGRDRRGRTPSGLPLLQCSELGRHAGRIKCIDCLGLRQIVGLPPSLQTDNDRSRRPLRSGRFMVLREKSFERRSGDRLRSGLTYFPGLQSAEFDWQPGGNQPLDRLRLAKFVQDSPCFQLGNHGRNAAVLGHQCPMMPIAQNAGNSPAQKFFRSGCRYSFYNKLRYITWIHIGSRERRKAQNRTLNFHYGIKFYSHRGRSGQRAIENIIDAYMSMT
jgi:hypothetical protein